MGVNTALGLPSIEDRRPYYDWILHLFQTGGAKEAEKQLASDVRAGRISSGDATPACHRVHPAEGLSAAEAELVRHPR